MTDPQATPELVARTANAMFGPGNDEVLNKHVAADRRQEFYENMVTPAVTKAIQKASETDPQVWANYSNWAQKNFVVFAKQTADSLQDSVTSRTVQAKIDYDPNTGLFKVDRPAPRQRTAGTKLADFTSTNEYGRVESIVSNFNRSIMALRPVLEADGGDVNEEIKGLVNALGVDVEKGKDPSLWQKARGAVNTRVGDAFSTMGQNPKALDRTDVTLDEIKVTE